MNELPHCTLAEIPGHCRIPALNSWSTYFPSHSRIYHHLPCHDAGCVHLLDILDSIGKKFCWITFLNALGTYQSWSHSRHVLNVEFIPLKNIGWVFLAPGAELGHWYHVKQDPIPHLKSLLSREEAYLQARNQTSEMCYGGSVHRARGEHFCLHDSQAVDAWKVGKWRLLRGGLFEYRDGRKYWLVVMGEEGKGGRVVVGRVEGEAIRQTEEHGP